jgi:hypothetical protein
LAIAFRDVFLNSQEERFYAVVGSSSPDCKVKINFKKGTFLFELKNYQFEKEN